LVVDSRVVVEMTAKMERSQFAGQDQKRYWRGETDEATVKTLAKMLREITHLKPPRGRTGRWLPFEGRYALELVSSSQPNASFVATQNTVTHDQEITDLENKGTGSSNYYTTTYTYTEDKERDLQRLAKMHKQYQSKTRVENTVNGLQDLIQGLMGLGFKNVQYDTIGYTEKNYQATLELEGFVITVQEKGVQQ